MTDIASYYPQWVPFEVERPIVPAAKCPECGAPLRERFRGESYTVYENGELIPGEEKISFYEIRCVEGHMWETEL